MKFLAVLALFVVASLAEEARDKRGLLIGGLAAPAVAAPIAPIAAPLAPIAAPLAPIAAPLAPITAPLAPIAAPISPIAAPISSPFYRAHPFAAPLGYPGYLGARHVVAPSYVAPGVWGAHNVVY